MWTVVRPRVGGWGGGGAGGRAEPGKEGAGAGAQAVRGGEGDGQAAEQGDPGGAAERLGAGRTARTLPYHVLYLQNVKKCY